jgi:hypothetical protein
MTTSVIVWDIETVPDLKGFAAANGLTGKSDDEIPAAMDDKSPKHIYHSIICIGALVAHQDKGSWIFDARGAPYVSERSEKDLISSFVDRVTELLAQSGENDTPIHISFDAEASEAVVDGRDSLYTAFQLSDAARARGILERLFGPAILRYADRAWGLDGDERIALCDLAVQDDAVVRAHAANKTAIAGRFGTRSQLLAGVICKLLSGAAIAMKRLDVGKTLISAFLRDMRRSSAIRAYLPDQSERLSETSS